MSDKFVCIHGHFYQPPRENPWLEAIEVQDSAYPYHDWNERIGSECYGPNGAARILGGDGHIDKIINNYAKISFNFGPTVLQWMEKSQPQKYSRIIDADKLSMEQLEGHGSAIAQVYNHIIMPLANTRDKNTQIIWGKKDFEFRFGRAPEGMWLAETAVDYETLDLLADHGIKYTILAPRQGHQVRPIGQEHWDDVSDGRIDPQRAYKAYLPSGKDMNLFFYDGPISQAIAFERLLVNGEYLAGRLLGAFGESDECCRLVHIATDGESYGHHHKHGEMALAYALDHIESNNLANIVNYGYFLEKFPPAYEADIYENSSWSCVHGVERWRSDCGCNSGGHAWNQAWRAPLRAALDHLRDSLAGPFEEAASKFLKDPWAARDDYIEVILDRNPESIDRYIAKHAVRELSEAEKIDVLRLMEMQRHCLLMYTSCGWFFDEISGMETVQVIEYAGRAVQLAHDIFKQDFESSFLEKLEQAKSNLHDFHDGRWIYEHWVRPHILSLADVGAHYAISSLFEDYGEQAAFSAFTAVQESYEGIQAGRMKFACGQVTVRSEITQESEKMSFGALHLGDHTIRCGVGPYLTQEQFEELKNKLFDPFKMADMAATLLAVDDTFKKDAYSLTSLFSDERRKVLKLIQEPMLEQAEALNAQLYENHAALVLFLRNSNLPVPAPLDSAAEFVLNERLKRAFNADNIEAHVIEPLLEEARLTGVNMDTDALEYAIRLNLENKGFALKENPNQRELMEEIIGILELINRLPFTVNTWRLQNIAYEILQDTYPDAVESAARDDVAAVEWVKLFRKLADLLWVRLPEWNHEGEAS